MQIKGLSNHVFPLKKIDIYAEGYFMDAVGRVFSTKNRGTPVMLGGSVTPSGRYYTLNKRTYRSDDLFRKAMNHGDFKAETGQASPSLPVKGVVAQGGLPVALSGRTKSAREAVGAKGYMLATLNPQGKLVFGTDPVFHLTDTTAKEEAERIAGETGAEVVMLQIVGKVKVQKAVWE